MLSPKCVFPRFILPMSFILSGNLRALKCQSTDIFDRSRLKHREKSQWSGFETCLMLLMMILILTDKNMKYSEINCFEIYTPVHSDTIRVC